jgi:hypothetical protein
MNYAAHLQYLIGCIHATVREYIRFFATIPNIGMTHPVIVNLISCGKSITRNTVEKTVFNALADVMGISAGW